MHYHTLSGVEARDTFNLHPLDSWASRILCTSSSVKRASELVSGQDNLRGPMRGFKRPTSAQKVWLQGRRSTESTGICSLLWGRLLGQRGMIPAAIASFRAIGSCRIT